MSTNLTPHSRCEEDAVDAAWRPGTFGPPDVIVLLCGIAAALSLLAYDAFIDEKQIPWDSRWMLAFPRLWSWLLPLAAGLLADVRSAQRWTLIIVVYAIVLPALSAWSLLPVAGETFLAPPVLTSTGPAGSALTERMYGPTLLGFMLMPLIRAFDRTQPLCNYAGVFQAAWRMTVQGLLAGALTASALTLLYLGAKLFEIIGLVFFVHLFKKDAFWRLMLPITFSISLIGIQRRPQLVLALQRAWLTLNGWMLPMASVLGVTFVAALGARFLFGWRAGALPAGVLIGFVAVWVKLVNATWQDGPGAALFGPALRRVLRWSLYCLLPLSALALYNVLVRVDQYGWTVPRVWAAFAAALAVLYGAGYAIAAGRPKRFYAALAATNYAAAFFAAVLLMMFSTPALDPRRVMAESQTGRLINGRLALAQFDFQMLASSAGPYGRIALQRLAEGAANERDLKIADLAREALAGSNIAPAVVPVEARNMPLFTVHPPGRDVPPKWWATVSERYSSAVSGCLPAAGQYAEIKVRAAPRCALIFPEPSRTGRESLILYVPADDKQHRAETFKVFGQTASGDWRLEGSLHQSID